MSNPISFCEQSLSEYFNQHPSEVKGRYNSDVETQRRYLYNKLYSVFKFTLPEGWELNYFRFWLFHYGSISVIYTNEFGWVAQPYSIKKLNIYYNPEVIEVYNQHINTPKTGIIGGNAAIIKCFDDYFSFDDLVSKYAVMLSQIDRSINVNLMNSNVTALFEAESKKQAEELKMAYQEATEGKPLVTINKDVMNGKGLTTLFPAVNGNFIVDKLLTARRSIVNQFLTEVGIRNANYDKKERLNSMEVSENNDETRAIVSVVFENLKESFRIVKLVSDLNIDVELAYDYSSGEEASYEI